MQRTLLLSIIFLGYSIFTFAQQKVDTAMMGPNKAIVSPPSDKTQISKQRTATTLDSGKVTVAPSTDTTPFMTPKKIGLMSAILPGFGQFKNKQYWKVGVIAVGVGAAAYFLYDNQKGYNDARSEQATRLAHQPSKYGDKYTNYTDQNLSDEVEYYQRNLDLTYVLTGVGYALQIIDAVVFAHLKGFDISEDLTLKWKPVLTPQGGPGFGLVMNF